jgi:drug/metabolite transporter (DMT)-like permease
MSDATHARRRHWADVVAIGAGVGAVGLAIALSGILRGQVNDSDRTALVCAVGGASSVLGLVLAQRAPGIGRLLVALGGLALLAAAFVFGRPVAWVWMLEMLLGVAMLGASAFVGRMPLRVPAGDLH